MSRSMSQSMAQLRRELDRLTAENGEIKHRFANLEKRVEELHVIIDEKEERINELEVALNSEVSLRERREETS